jgi:hypothetical protein
VDIAIGYSAYTHLKGVAMINWDIVENFKPYEFIDDTDMVEPELIYSMDSLRNRAKNRIFPSPVRGSMVRFDGSETSQHYAVGRLSTAIDIFCEGYPMVSFIEILNTKNFNGIGVYVDTNGPDGKPWTMFHIDIRKRGFDDTHPLIWVSRVEIVNRKKKRKYYYPQTHSQYWSLLHDNRMFEPRYKSGKA